VRVRFFSDNITRLITNVSEVKVAGKLPITSFEELKTGLSVNAYWPYTGGFYPAAIISITGK